MGREIERNQFRDADFVRFAADLSRETELLGGLFEDNRFANAEPLIGYELEGWLTESSFQPAAANERFLRALNNPQVGDELSQYNIEINGSPRPLAGDGDSSGLARMEAEMRQFCNGCRQQAEAMGLNALFCGILPTLTEAHLSMDIISDSKRYLALNDQLLKLRHGQPFRFNIKGAKDHFVGHTESVMLESAATALQLHLEVPEPLAVKFYNAALMASAPVLAVSGNSPFLFGKDLWAESRLPLFKQAIDVGDMGDRPLSYVTFGSGYLKHSVFEMFVENQLRYPVLLPDSLEESTEQLPHLLLHHGAIWRWNRPIVGFKHGQPFLRFEHRALPAGPSAPDMVANAALFIGLVYYLASRKSDAEDELNFYLAEKNFYDAARLGLDAELNWLNGMRASAATLVSLHLIPMAKDGLLAAGVPQATAEHYLNIVAERVASKSTGAEWQRRWLAANGTGNRESDLQQLTARYAANQQQEKPVHEWPLD